MDEWHLPDSTMLNNNTRNAEFDQRLPHLYKLETINGYFYRCVISIKNLISVIVDGYVGGSMNSCFMMFLGQK